MREADVRFEVCNAACSVFAVCDDSPWLFSPEEFTTTINVLDRPVSSSSVVGNGITSTSMCRSVSLEDTGSPLLYFTAAVAAEVELV